MKKIIFFDGDGTLWYPRSTKKTKKPHWVYHDSTTKDNYLEHIMLIPGVLKTLKKLLTKKIILVVISANPNVDIKALKEIEEKLEYFKIIQYFSNFFVSDGADPQGKSKRIISVLKQLNLSPDDALMIGDSYYYDYLAAKSIGVEALYIENNYSKKPEVISDDIKIVSGVADIISYLDF